MKLGLIVYLLLCIACSISPSDDYEKALTLNYYYEFTDESNTSFSRDAIEEIKKALKNKVYIITPGSGKGNWPYFKEVVDVKNFPRDSILPPHPGLHKFFDINDYSNQQEKHYKVQVTFYPSQPDSLNVGMEVMMKNCASCEWENLVDMGSLNFYNKKYTFQSELIKDIEQHIVFVTFK